ncbi:fimbrial protein [Escherichia coli]|uniref:fimbrial protein n=1 Tax=Escherichia coli TaxID=562 RepID=UPI003F530C49
MISGYSLRNDFNFGQTRLRAACSPADKRIFPDGAPFSWISDSSSRSSSSIRGSRQAIILSPASVGATLRVVRVKSFNIKLNDCDTNVSSNAAVAFLGTTVTSNDDTLALQSSAAGSAQNVGIQILDSTGEVLVLDGATFSAKTDLIDGTNILPFQARYIALGQSVAGTANADATFKVQYL